MNKKYFLPALAVLAVGAFIFLKPVFWIEEGRTPNVIEYLEEKPYYEIKAVYPKNAPQAVEDWVMETVRSFKEESGLNNLTQEDIELQGLGEDRKYSLGISFTSHSSERTNSLVFTIYADTLGAHPNTFYRTFAFDKQGRELTLEDLFKPGSRYLDRLSEEAYKRVLDELKTRADSVDPEMEDTVRLGTAPSPEALQFFYLTDDSLHLLFPPYQVAAYAAGAFDIAIPLNELQDILDI